MTWMFASRRSQRIVAGLGVAVSLGAAALHQLPTASAEPLTYSLFSTQDTSSAKVDPDRSSVELGVRFTTTKSGTISAIRFLKAPDDSSRHVVSLWSKGSRVGTGVSSNETPSGWQQVALDKPVHLISGQTYTASFHTNRYLATQSFFSKDVSAGPLHVSKNGGVYAYGNDPVRPTQTWQSTNYWVDVVFTTTTTATTEPVSTSSTTSVPTTTVKPTTTSTTPLPTTTSPPVSNGAFPNASNTGVPAAVTLSQYSGSNYITQDNIVIDGKILDGLCIQANNVTVKNSLVRGGISMPTGGAYGGCPGAKKTNLVVSDTTITGSWIAGTKYTAEQEGELAASTGIQGDNFSCFRCNISRFGIAVYADSNVTVQDSYLHDFVGTNQCSRWVGSDCVSHNSGIGGLGAVNNKYIHNNIDGGFINGKDGMSGAIVIYADSNGLPADNVLVQNNLLNGGGYCIYPGVAHDGDTKTYVRDVRVVDNHFGKKYSSKCGGYGPVASPTGTITWTGNVWDDTGAAVPLS